MGHPILKHMNSFKASNDLKYNPVVDKASALRQNNGSMAYQKEDTPLEGNAFGKAMADNNGNYEAAKKTLAPSMHGALHMGKGAPTRLFGGKGGDESDKTKQKVKEVKADAKKDYK